MRFEDIGTIAGGALHKEPAELTDDERVAIAVMAGCTYEIDWNAQRINITNPIGFARIDGKLQIYESVARRGAALRRGEQR